MPQSQQPEQTVLHVPEPASQPLWFTHEPVHGVAESLPASAAPFASLVPAASTAPSRVDGMTPASKKRESKSRPQPAVASNANNASAVTEARGIAFFRTTPSSPIMLTRVRRFALGLAIALYGVPASAAPESVEEARALMQEGNARLHAGKPAEALEKLERSLALVYSPNTELLYARALRDLGRRVDAARAFEHAELEARKRSLAGDVKYGMTEASAHEEGAKVRASLGTLRIHVSIAANRTTLTVDGAPIPLEPDGFAAVLHEPGRAEIALKVGDAEQKQTVPVVAGQSVQVEFGGTNGGDRPAPPPSAAPIDRPPVVTTTSSASSASWATPAAVVSGSFTAVGLGVFTIFGLRTESAWSELQDRCGKTGCGDGDRARANQGERDQIIANSGLVVASVAAVAAVAAVAFIVISLTSSSSSSTAVSSFDARRRGGL